MNRFALHAVLIAGLLGVVAAVAPTPKSDDREIYQQIGRHLLIRDCSDGHCFRPLVAAVVEQLPGPSRIKWKSYAVLANAAAALAVARLCLLIGLPASAGIAAAWLSAFGTGSLYSLFDSYTSDPLMYLIGPVMAIELWQGRVGRAGLFGAIGVFAKEFAAAPLWIFTFAAALKRRWGAAFRMLLVSTGVMLVWFAMHTWLMSLLNYRYGASASADLLHGGFLAPWLRSVGVSGAAMYLFTAFGALYVLFPAGLLKCGRDLRLLALASVPVAAVFVYVEQPERALWNFHFIVVPMSVLALQAVPAWARVLFVACFAIANLRFGAQLDIRPAARIALVGSVMIASAAAALSFRRVSPLRQASPDAADTLEPRRRLWPIALGQAAAFAVLALVMIDVRAHRLVEAEGGVNQWGFRGPLHTASHPGVDVAVVGGSTVFDTGTPWAATIPARLAVAINDRQNWKTPGGPFAEVENLAEDGGGPQSYVATLQDYAYLDPDVVCLVAGYRTLDDAPAPHRRRRSIVFRTVGYLPMPAARPEQAATRGGIAPALQDGPAGAADPSCDGVSASYCAGMVDAVDLALGRGDAVVVASLPIVSTRHETQQRSLAQLLDRRFGRHRRFRYVSLGPTVDMRNPEESADGVHPTGVAKHRIAVQIATVIAELMADDGRVLNP